MAERDRARQAEFERQRQQEEARHAEADRARQAEEERRVLAEAERDRLRQAELARQRQREEERRAEAERARQAEEERRVLAEAERQARAVAVAAKLSEQLGNLDDGAAVLVALGQEGGRLRRNLRGQLLLFDPSRPATGCAIAGLGTDAEFLGFVEDQHRPFVGAPGRAVFRAGCPGPDVLGNFDMVVVHRPAANPAAVPVLEAVQARIADGRLQAIERVTLGAWQDDVRRRLVAQGEERRQREALVAAIRDDALAGRLDGWAAVTLRAGRSDATCVVSDADPRWGGVLAEYVPQETRGLTRRIQADADADRQFARLLAGECGLLIAKGSEFGDVLRGLDANRREGVVLPIRIEATAVHQAVAPPPTPPTVATPQIAVQPAQPMPVPSAKDLATQIGVDRPGLRRSRLPACEARETFSALSEAIKENVAAQFVNLRLLDLQEVREITPGQGDQRRCSAVAVLNSGREAIVYSITTSQMQSGAFLVEVSD